MYLGKVEVIKKCADYYLYRENMGVCVKKRVDYCTYIGKRKEWVKKEFITVYMGKVGTG